MPGVMVHIDSFPTKCARSTGGRSEIGSSRKDGMVRHLSGRDLRDSRGAEMRRTQRRQQWCM
ncbi:hypothetical protein BDV95DRAFT_574203 [Massariosphaeria phaeospora]|uniref:Uncharacterized protein n=1 Tax=Massariosphaeria phaeospora TaxID=100035 RepID=A0A7C8MDH6_9PLEO|nr:hypothetical protein BDV95DRAFT_574203 [Massariosphaeria phaeospora]